MDFADGFYYHDVFHGDVKPQNIIVQPESHTVVLVDYGFVPLF
jgi:serine/threonine protein kinase